MADALKASFIKRFTTGTAIRAELEPPSDSRSITVLFGPSGCGKTTVLRCLAGLEQPEEGTIQFGPEIWFDARQHICLPPQRRGVGFVFQEYALFPHLNVAGNIGYGLSHLPGSERTRRIGQMLELFGLQGMEHRRPHQLSGGQQQRVALARAIAFRPQLLLLDEPLSAIDTSLRRELRHELRQQLAACDMPVYLVTHDREEALALGDHLIVMSGGSIRQSGPVLEVFNRPADPEVAAIVGMETFQPGRVLEVNDGLATVEIGAARLLAVTPSAAVRDVFVCIRGEDVTLERGGAAVSSVRNRLRARVVKIHAGVPLMRIELDAGFLLFALVTRPACEALDLRPGQEITALIKAPAVQLIQRGDR